MRDEWVKSLQLNEADLRDHTITITAMSMYLERSFPQMSKTQFEAN